MNTQENNQTRSWLTVDQAFLSCQEAGLNRTKKTIRSWCRHDHVESQKQTTPTGERWMVEETSLDVKIRSELEFQQQRPQVQTGANLFEPARTQDEPVRTLPNTSEPVQARPHGAEQERTNPNSDERVKELEAKLRSLEIDKAVRDKQIEFLSNQNEEGQKSLLSQSRYIGHLETEIRRLGGRPDQTFLQPPIPQSQPDSVVHRDQRPLDGVH